MLPDMLESTTPEGKLSRWTVISDPEPHTVIGLRVVSDKQPGAAYICRTGEYDITFDGMVFPVATPKWKYGVRWIMKDLRYIIVLSCFGNYLI